MNNKIWLSSPHMGGNELNYINEAFEANWVAPLGPNVDGFENDLKVFLNNDVEVAALSSGTAALHLALIQCDVKFGDEVICQSLTFSASANPIAYLGATPVFVDSEFETWNMCPEALETAILERLKLGKRVKAIIVVHLYGMPAKMDELCSIASKYNIPVIEDAAEALGSNYKGKLCGTFGRFGVLSFNGNKIITTSGGGALVCTNKLDKNKTIFLSTQARDEAPHYQHSEIGYNYRMSNVSAGIGRGQMEVLVNRIDSRREMFQFYSRIFSKIEGVNLHAAPNADFYSNHWLTAITLNPEICKISPEKLRLYLASKNIECRPIWKPMHLQPVFATSPYYGTNNSEDLFNTGLCLPSGSNLTDSDRNRIEEALFEVLSK